MTKDHEAATGVERADLFEAQDVNANGVIVFLAGLIGSLVVIMLLVWGMWRVYERILTKTGTEPVPAMGQVPPEPRIQVDPGLDLWRLRAREDAVLNSYGWSEQQAGAVRIPIGRAMDLLAERGLPVRSGAEAAAGAPDTGPESGGPQTGHPVPRRTQ